MLPGQVVRFLCDSGASMDRPDCKGLGGLSAYVCGFVCVCVLRVLFSVCVLVCVCLVFVWVFLCVCVCVCAFMCFVCVSDVQGTRV